MKRKIFAALLAMPFLFASARSQEKSSAPQAVSPAPAAKDWPAANPKDVESLDSIMAAVYDVISGPPGERNWNRFRSLFIPEARLIPVNKNEQGEWHSRTLTPQDFADLASAHFKTKGFYEREISRKTETFGHITHVFSTYESRETPDAKPFARGINSFQLFNDGKRWYCVTIYWNAETPENPIPDRYLTH